METAFEQVYQDNHRKRLFKTTELIEHKSILFFIILEPIPIVLMNEDENIEEDAASDRTLVAENIEDEQPAVEYRLATQTPTVNPNTIIEELPDDDEATLADPTIMTLQTPLPEQSTIKQKQNMLKLLDKIERQRKAAQNRSEQQTAVVTPTVKTPAKLIVSPGYVQSSTSPDSSEQSDSSANTTTAEIEQRRIQLEFVYSSSVFSFESNFSFLKISKTSSRRTNSIVISTCSVSSSKLHVSNGLIIL